MLRFNARHRFDWAHMRVGLWLSSIVTVVAMAGCSENGPVTVGENSCKLKSFTVNYDKSRMCIYTCKGGELEGRTRSQAQGDCLDYVPSAK